MSNPNLSIPNVETAECPTHGNAARVEAYGRVWTRVDDAFIPMGGDLHVEAITVEEAMLRCTELPGCRGFTFHGDSEGVVQVFFKAKSTVGGDALGWTSYLLDELAADETDANVQRPVSAAAPGVGSDGTPKLKRVRWASVDGCIAHGGDLHVEMLTVADAMAMSRTLPGCLGFTFPNTPEAEAGGAVVAYFKNKSCVETSVEGWTVGWTSYILEEALGDDYEPPEEGQAAERIVRLDAVQEIGHAAPKSQTTANDEHNSHDAPVGLTQWQQEVGNDAPAWVPRDAMWKYFAGCIPRGGDLHVDKLTVEDAMRKCANLPGCKGFTFQGVADGTVEVYFKNHSLVETGVEGWTSYIMGRLQATKVSIPPCEIDHDAEDRCDRADAAAEERSAMQDERQPQPDSPLPEISFHGSTQNHIASYEQVDPDAYVPKGPDDVHQECVLAQQAQLSEGSTRGTMSLRSVSSSPRHMMRRANSLQLPIRTGRINIPGLVTFPTPGPQGPPEHHSARLNQLRAVFNSTPRTACSNCGDYLTPASNFCEKCGFPTHATAMGPPRNTGGTPIGQYGIPTSNRSGQNCASAGFSGQALVASALAITPLHVTRHPSTIANCREGCLRPRNGPLPPVDPQRFLLRPRAVGPANCTLSTVQLAPF